MQLGCTVATHLVKIVVLGKTTALATKIVEKAREAALLLRQISQIRVDILSTVKEAVISFFTFNLAISVSTLSS